MPRCSVSVALATCNGGRFLAQQLADFAAQSFLPAELVVCDDASTDDTVSILNEFAATAPFPVHIHRNGQRLGYRENFVKCANLCSSDLIAFSDQDDRWDADKLEVVVGRFNDPDVLLVFHNAKVAADPDRSHGSLYPTCRGMETSPPLSLGPWDFAPGFTQTFRRSLLRFDQYWRNSKDQSFKNEPLAHDRWYFFLASMFGTIIYLPEQLATYRQHGHNLFGFNGFMPSFSRRLINEVENAGWAIPNRVQAAASRAGILEEVADALDEPWKSRALEGARKYRKLEARSLLRASLYEARDFRSRAKALMRLRRAKAYDGSAWRFGPMGLMMDCTVGLARLYPRATPGERELQNEKLAGESSEL